MTSLLKQNYPVFAVMFVAFLIVTFLITRPLEFLITDLIPDDAFYYFEIARNITHGLGSTFDGVNLTNGYHPLWMVTILPLWDFLSQGGVADSTPIRAVLMWSAVLYFATGGLLYSLIRRYTHDTWIAAGVLAFWFLNPYVLYESLSGLETPLSLLFIVLMVFMARHSREEMFAHGTLYRKTLVTTGVIGGLMMLARLDNIFYFVMFLVWLVYAFRANGVRFAGVVGITASLIVSPFLLWNAHTFGMLFTSASVTSTAVNHHLIEQDNGRGFLVFPRAIIYTVERGIEDVFTQTGAPLAVLIFFGLAGGWLWFGGGAGRRLHWSNISPEMFLFSGFLLHFFISTAGRLSYRSWYFIPFNIFVALAAAWFLGELHRQRGIPRIAIVLGLAFTLGLFAISWDKNLQHRQIAQLDMLHAAQWMNEHAPNGSIIGVFNAGVQGYFSAHRVVNLDGLVNNAASRAMLDRELWDYAINRERVDYISDFPLYITYRYREFLGTTDPFQNLRLLHEISDAGEHSRGAGLYIYQVVRP